MRHTVDFKDLPANSKTPIFSYCRKLIKDGFDEGDQLDCFRGERLDFTVKNIGIGAKLTVEENRDRGPLFRMARDCWTGASRIR